MNFGRDKPFITRPEFNFKIAWAIIFYILLTLHLFVVDSNIFLNDFPHLAKCRSQYLGFRQHASYKHRMGY